MVDYSAYAAAVGGRATPMRTALAATVAAQASAAQPAAARPGPRCPHRRAGQPRDRAAGAVLKPGADWEIHEPTWPRRKPEVLVRMAYATCATRRAHAVQHHDRTARGRRARGLRCGWETGPGDRAGPRRSRGAHVRRGLRALPLVRHRPGQPVRGRGQHQQRHDGRRHLPVPRRGAAAGRAAAGQLLPHGTFAEYAVVSQDSCVKVDPDLPLAAAALVSCGC